MLLHHMPQLVFDRFTITPNCQSNCCLFGSRDSIHEVLRGQAHPFDIIIEARTYLLLDKDKKVVLSSDTFPRIKEGVSPLQGKSLEEIFDEPELLFWKGLVELAWVSKACVELRASENHTLYKILVKAIWNDEQVHGCLISRFPYSTTPLSSSFGDLTSSLDESSILPVPPPAGEP